MTGRRLLILLALCVALTPLAAWAAFSVPPKPPNGIHDGADVLTPDQERRLAQKLAAFKKASGPEIGVAIVPSLDGGDLSQVRYAIFNEWKIGDAQRNDGVLLLVVVDKARAAKPGAESCGCAGIEVGRYLEGDLTDLQSKQILRTEFIGPVTEGKFYEAIDAATDGLMAVAGGDSEAARKYKTTADSGGDEGGGFPWWGWVVIFLIAIVLEAMGVPVFEVVFAIFSAGRGGSSGGGGFGGGGGGGGGFGGGGSSGGGGANI